MKLLIFLAVTSVAVMLVMVAQVVRQEMMKSNLKTSMQDKATQLSRNEKAISDFKVELTGLKPKLLSLTKLTEELKRKKDNFDKESKTLQDNISKCNKEKDGDEKSKTETTENLDKQKSDHNQAKENAQMIIQDLKEKNLDLEKAICALVDATNADARKLCGLN